MTARLPFERWLAGLAFAALLLGCSERAGAPAAPTVAAPASTLQASAPSAASTSASTSTVVTYLRGAEIQAETDAQRRELQRALSDLLDKPVAALRGTRYAGPGGEPGQRDLVQVLRGHLVPTSPQLLDANSLYAEKDQPEARAALREKLEQVERSLQTPKK